MNSVVAVADGRFTGDGIRRTRLGGGGVDHGNSGLLLHSGHDLTEEVRRESGGGGGACFRAPGERMQDDLEVLGIGVDDRRQPLVDDAGPWRLAGDGRSGRSLTIKPRSFPPIACHDRPNDELAASCKK